MKDFYNQELGSWFHPCLCFKERAIKYLWGGGGKTFLRI